MDTETLVNVNVPALSSKELELGADVAELFLNDSVLKPSALLWWYDLEAAKWKYVVSTLVHDKSPRQAYTRIRRLLSDAGLLGSLPLDRVWAVSEDFPAVEQLRRTVGTGRKAFTFLNCSFFGLPIAGVHVYWVSKRRARVRKMHRNP